MKDEKENTAKKPLENDPRRFAYMIAWRDRYIEALKQELAGWEEKDALLCSLLYCALARIASEGEEKDGGEVLIEKSEVTKLLGTFECHTSDTGDAYAVRFTKKQEQSQASAKEDTQASAQGEQTVAQNADRETAQEGITGEHADGGEAQEG
ncbi:MAG: hypothetical protein J6B09_00160 [Clostridia bacterium]|nr:hypothetical protein [Clostridia bacterium]